MKEIKYRITATLKRLDDSVLISKTEKFKTDQACIDFMKEINRNKCWKKDKNLELIGKPIIYCE